MCGENTAALPAPPPFHGSPPRVRGKRNKVVTSTSDQRITPACAGKTSCKVLFLPSSSDHPRVCGENASNTASGAPYCGSPPRVRGKLHNKDIMKQLSRITPACAGKTGREHGNSKAVADHPRVCGENRASMQRILPWLGSPPRVRGKLLVTSYLGLDVRITPACAGKTQDNHDMRTLWADHPRVCGENPAARASVPCSGGSPPRVRGKHRALYLPINYARITPACAGKTTASPAQICPTPDHPRVCGENQEI